MACWDSLYVSCFRNRWKIELYPCLKAFSKQSFAWRYFSLHRGAIPFWNQNSGMDGASNFPLVSRRVCSVGIKHVPQVQQSMSSAQHFEQLEHWVLEAISHNSKHSTFTTLWIIFFDSSLKGLHVQLLCRSAVDANLFGWFLTWRTDLLISQHVEYLGFWSQFKPVCPWSATGLSVLVLRWWESSRWTCRVSFRKIFGGGRGKETFWYRIVSLFSWSVPWFCGVSSADVASDPKFALENVSLFA